MKHTRVCVFLASLTNLRTSANGKHKRPCDCTCQDKSWQHCSLCFGWNLDHFLHTNLSNAFLRWHIQKGFLLPYPIQQCPDRWSWLCGYRCRPHCLGKADPHCWTLHVPDTPSSPESEGEATCTSLLKPIHPWYTLVSDMTVMKYPNNMCITCSNIDITWLHHMT